MEECVEAVAPSVDRPVPAAAGLSGSGPRATTCGEGAQTPCFASSGRDDRSAAPVPGACATLADLVAARLRDDARRLLRSHRRMAGRLAPGEDAGDLLGDSFLLLLESARRDPAGYGFRDFGDAFYGQPALWKRADMRRKRAREAKALRVLARDFASGNRKVGDAEGDR